MYACTKTFRTYLCILAYVNQPFKCIRCGFFPTSSSSFCVVFFVVVEAVWFLYFFHRFCFASLSLSRCMCAHIFLGETIVRQSSFNVAFTIVIVACTCTHRRFFLSVVVLAVVYVLFCFCWCDLHVFGYTVNTLDLCTITTLVIIVSAVQTLQCLCEKKKLSRI